MKRKFVLQAAVALFCLWTAVWGVGRLADAAQPSASRLLAYLRTEPLERGERSRAIEHVAREYNRLNFVEKRTLRSPAAEGVFDDFISSLSREEKTYLVDLIMPAEFERLLDGFSRLSERDRLKMIERSRREISEHLPDSPTRAMIDQAGPQMLANLANGLGDVYRGLPPDAKLQMLPFIEQVQNNARRLRD